MELPSSSAALGCLVCPPPKQSTSAVEAVKEIGYDISGPSLLGMDSQSTIAVSKNPEHALHLLRAQKDACLLCSLSTKKHCTFMGSVISGQCVVFWCLLCSPLCDSRAACCDRMFKALKTLTEQTKHFCSFLNFEVIQ